MPIVSLPLKKQMFANDRSVTKLTVKSLKITNAPDAPAHQELIKSEKVAEIIINDCRITIREVALLIDSCYDIYTNVAHVSKICSIIVKFWAKTVATRSWEGVTKQRQRRSIKSTTYKFNAIYMKQFERYVKTQVIAFASRQCACSHLVVIRKFLAKNSTVMMPSFHKHR